MRIDTKKFLFVGLEAEKAYFFKKAQEIGIVHFLNESSLQLSETSESLQLIQQAIRAVKGLVPTEQDERTDYYKAEEVAKTITSLKNEKDLLEEKVRTLKLEISRIHVFGSFSKEEIALIEKETGRFFQFFCAKIGLFSHDELPKEVIYVGSDHGLDYFVSIQKHPFQMQGLVEMQIDRPMGELKRELFEAEKRIHEIEKAEKPLAKFNRFLHNALTVTLNDHNLKTAMSYPKQVLDGSIFAVTGWVPQDKVGLLKEITEGLDVHYEEIAKDKEEVAPTYLENTGLHRLGEDLVHIYDTPSNTDKDPSLWVLFFFSVFFAFIVGDGGYGLVYLLAALFIYYRSKKVTKGGTRLFKICTIVFSSCIVWGLFTNSFFGIPFAKDSFLKKISVLQWLIDKKAAYHMKANDAVYHDFVKKYPEALKASTPEQFLENGDIANKFSDNIMFELALLIGVIHICLSLARYAKRNWPAIGWIIAIIGAYLYFPIYLDATSLMTFAFGVSKEVAAREGFIMMCSGFTLAMVLAFIQHKVWGILEAMNVIQIFADIMSYLRLYALGLAGGIVTGVINEFSLALGPFLGVILLILGHAVNLVLGIMGGVIHGLRLNFLEWYHYSFEGGGKRFTPLESYEIE